MLSQPPKLGLSGWRSLVLAVLCGAAPGCQSLGDSPKPAVANEPKAEKPFSWMEKLRPDGPKVQPLGLDPRAQEIERHVGVH